MGKQARLHYESLTSGDDRVLQALQQALSVVTRTT